MRRTSLPDYLRPYVVDQQWEDYTSRQHATWRYIMRQAREFFRNHAHSIYLEGLKKTGIPISQIPRIEEMDAKLQELGWGAVCVCGFIPPLTFLDFQSRKILPIAADMRSLEHLTYTPAPDIVHEAAGHAPILADPAFAQYLTDYATLAHKAIFSIEDIKLYEAIRSLSDAKENPDATSEDIARAEQLLAQATAAISWVSEASEVARMNWWTAEYGLIGNVDNPQIYGAGLLSSLGEGRSCLEAEVKKIPLSLDCIRQGYDITKPQPQLFVAKSFTQLSELLEALGKTMAFSVGGSKGLAVAQRAQTVTTTVLDSGLEISGVVQAVREQGAKPWFVQWSGGVQLCVAGNQLPDHGTKRHAHGFSGPIGTWQAFPQRSPDSLSDAELSSIGIHRGSKARLVLSSGATIEGVVKTWVRKNGKLVLITWDECTVTYQGEQLFKREWGEFDQPVGNSVVSVYGGPADRQAYGAFYIGKPSSTPGRTSPYTEAEKELFRLYQRVRDMRQDGLSQASAQVFGDFHQEVSLELMERFPEEWLLGVELVELHAQAPARLKQGEFPWLAKLKTSVLAPGRYDRDTQRNISLGLQFAAVVD